jgi:hypothetical protein
MALFMMMVPLTASAFDGERKGFMLNLGAGFGQTFSSSGSYNTTGFVTDFKIGGGPSNNVQIYYTNRVLWYSYDFTSTTYAKGLSAVGVSYFLKPHSPSFFFSGALGLGAINSSSGRSSDAKLGFTLGAGVEFAHHFIAELTIMNAIDLGTNLMLSISWLAY